MLRYYAYFQENILFSPEEESHVRPVVIYYYLEDDSMCIIEPVVENSGLPQGKRIKRQRLPKNERGEHYHWKDLNIGADLEAYGVTYHITQCDAFTEVSDAHCAYFIFHACPKAGMCAYPVSHSSREGIPGKRGHCSERA